MTMKSTHGAERHSVLTLRRKDDGVIKVFVVTGYLALAISGCSKGREPIVPCISSIDRIDMGDAEAMKNFLNAAVPLNSPYSCAQKVMSGKKMVTRGRRVDVLGKVYYGYSEGKSRYLRPFYWVSLGYIVPQITFHYENEKLIKLVVI